MNKFQEIIESAHRIMIVSHIKPDYDAVCSMLAIYNYIKIAFPNKDVQLYLSNEKNSQFDYLPGSDKINWISDISDVINNFDTLIFLDGNSVYRFSNEKEKIDLSKFKTVCIDHHPNVPDKFDLDLSDINAASATQLIYKLFFRENKNLLSKEIVEIILTGILADTGTFRYINASKSETLLFAKELIEIGDLEIQSVELPITQMDEDEFALIQILIANTTKVSNGYTSFMYSYAPLELLKDYSINVIKNASDKFKMMFLRQVKGYNWGFIVTPDSEEQFGISFRSTTGSPNVRELAIYFNGGGHIYAAGGYIKKEENVKESKDACDIVVDYIKNSNLVSA